MRCFCGYPLTQEETEPFLCTHPTAAHKTVRDTFGLALWEPKPIKGAVTSSVSTEEAVQPVEAPPAPDANAPKRDKQK